MENNNNILRELGLPVFKDEVELASLMHINPEILTPIIEKSKNFYKKFNKKKNIGKWRRIYNPCSELKAIQAWILRYVLDEFFYKRPVSKYAKAYIYGKSILDNVTPHSDHKYFLCIDLEEFFPSISINRIKNKFNNLGYSEKSADILAKLCTCEGKLPQGAITSPSISNWIASQLDKRIGGYSSRLNIYYTRYSDDITLSSNDWAILPKSIARILKIIKSEHFKPNYEKIRFLGPDRRCSITGLIKDNNEECFRIGIYKKRKMRAIMHHWILDSKIDEKYNSEESIYGWIEFLKKVDNKSYHQMNKYLNRLIEKHS